MSESSSMMIATVNEQIAVSHTASVSLTPANPTP